MAKNPTVRRKKLTASFLLPSIAINSGSETKRNPMTAADMTKRLSTVIGMTMVSVSPANVETAYPPDTRLAI